ncbi:hypothetical protein M3Y97_00022900 [Aphelenchoides bicaudatus]|nr:hypothetical protein M3Y97_00022900 [Aphelenchoides bicaudatus]
MLETDFNEEHSFSSISSVGQRKQFKKALTDLNSTVYGLSASSRRRMDQSNLLDLDNEMDDGGQNSNNLNTLPVERVKNNSAPSECSQDSEASSNDFVKFDDQEIANLPGADFLSQFGNRVASDALDSALEDSRPRMDERDLFVPEGAGDAERHSQPRSHDLDEFDPLASVQHHDLETVPEQKQADFGFDDQPTRQHVDFDEGQFISKPKHDEVKPKEPETPIDNANEEVIERSHHVPLTTDNEPSNFQEKIEQDYNEIAEEIRDAVKDTQEKASNWIEEFQQHQAPKQSSPEPQNEQYSPADSGKDVLSELKNSNDNGLPVSESVSSGMRDLSPELTTFERGPLTIPTANTASAPPADEFDDYPQQQARPPTPPKELNEPGEVNPQKLDLGPPPSSHHLSHRTSEHGLHSILKHDSDKAWVDFRSIPEPVQEILLWRDPKNSAIALAASLFALILVAKFTFISLLAWGSLLVLGGTLGFRVFKLVEAQIKKTDGSNPFKPYMETEINVPQEKVHAQADVLVHHGQSLINQLRRLFLVENLFDSVKFGVLLWTLTYIGAWFSGLTLITIFVLGLFSVPKVYELYKEPIDEYIGLAKQNVDKVNQIVQEKLPFLKQAEKVEKKE